MPRPDRPHPHLWPLLRVLLVAVIGLTACDPTAVPTELEHRRASEAIDRWAARYSDSWAISRSTSSALRRDSYSVPCAESPPSAMLSVRYASPGLSAALLLRCPISGAPTAAELSRALVAVVLDDLPHGMSMSGWTFSVVTPSSHVSSGVTFEDLSGGRVRMSVETPLYAA